MVAGRGPQEVKCAFSKVVRNVGYFGTRRGGSQMRGLEAQLDLASIDKVDVRNELRRFTVLPATEADFQNFASYSNLCVSVK